MRTPSLFPVSKLYNVNIKTKKIHSNYQNVNSYIGKFMLLPKNVIVFFFVEISVSSFKISPCYIWNQKSNPVHKISTNMGSKEGSIGSNFILLYKRLIS